MRSLPRLLLLLALLLLPAAADWKDYIRNLNPVEPGLYSFAHHCRLRENPIAYLNASFAAQFVGQASALEVVKDVISDWHAG